ncbi:iron chelate uptake ABC transporter family permease subunit [Glutamicibacter sp. MNS18]|uniref:FecCD family ABC transporter permease n=1 Tax=Glutamicibacter sp. MNS18 TaxID=2989817 RepID=UPI0022358175|nr:iron chelate uptake ABC transporter family permease subunit [Glutamicibacter sp. MNS18]MCW4467203.1 iron chelate uptake ABC transporter family permease subunit [Glutamicibacter sp. MNS18]
MSTSTLKCAEAIGPVPTGRRNLVLPLGSARWLLDVRSLLVGSGLAAAAILLALVSLGLGDVKVPFNQVLAALVGAAEPKYQLVVIDWRLTRALLALVFGFALGISGALFQSLTRNPLGSPDVIGFNTGAYTGALALMFYTAATPLQLAAGSITSGLLTALLVFVLASRNGTTGFRLIVVGIGVGAMLASLNTYMLIVAERQIALAAAVWGAGSLNSVGNDVVGGSLAVIMVLALAALALQHRARILECGDRFACSLGVNARRVRLGMVVTGVGLVAVPAAAAGPIAFVALAAPQISKRLTRRDELDLLPAGAMGALMLVAADTIARTAFGQIQLPVGVVTVSIGGIYLIWLLIREARR